MQARVQVLPRGAERPHSKTASPTNKTSIYRKANRVQKKEKKKTAIPGQTKATKKRVIKLTNSFSLCSRHK